MTEPKIIHEDADIIVLAKPAGLQVHAARVSAARAARGEKKEPPPTLVDWLVKKYPEIRTVGDDPELRPGIVHRLDKETSGVMLIARNQRSFERLKEIFQAREMKKTYLAAVVGVPKEKKGTIETPIGIVNGTMKRSTRSEKMAKPAFTEYKVLKAADGAALLEVRPRTGRTHQIRVHLASIGHPILGDALYGPGRKTLWRGAPPGRLMLHAFSIEFTDLEGKRVRFEAEAPSEFTL